ncbi:POZ (BTB) and AT hook-containing zinc finger 1 isoform X1 [Boleophthalmus pectinirostris]|uniref:POZ (BTB) and AT hook-containing zinc finger 1 isoform X1 n=1 Tax=Boleophthalmus pectinirostris TaxID=150288 RepID=UPI00242F8C61|nr:POZ (BTB) and AT hook-containing zinc finger 1 isoform X1 [Boleophthalmus pectinirostris]
MEKVAEPSWTSSYTYQVSKHSTEMLHNLNAQRKDGGRFCDVVLRVGEESFPAHKAVLAACSEYFESVFSRQSEGDAKELEMHTISPKVFKDILDFAYTSRIVVRLECFPELMTAAKFLLMRSVIEICQEVIKQSNVQILVPTLRGSDASLFQIHTEPPALSLCVTPQDLINGMGMHLVNGQTPSDLDGSEASAAVLLEDPGEPIMPTLQPVDGVSPSMEIAGAMLHHDNGSPTSKRNKSSPKKPGVDTVHLDQQKDIGLFPCRTCGKAFTEASRLKNHEAQHGASSGSVTSLAAPGGLSLVENGVQLHGALAPDNSRKRERTRRHVGCDICGKVFRDVYHLNRHKLSHSGEKPYACHVCGLRFKRKDRMSYHVRSHDGSVGKPYVCQSCGKGFSRPDHLNGHIKQVHTTERPHKCQICNASFATRDRLRSHLVCHEDKIPCKVCGKFLRAAYMTDHLKKHSEGPHNFCSICNKGFSTASYLKVHIKTHHGTPLPPSFPDPRAEPQMHHGTPYHMGRQCSVEDLCTSRQLQFTSSEAEGRFHGLSGHTLLPQSGPPVGSQPELLMGKPGGAPYFWECRSGLPGFPVHGSAADGQENTDKCPHLESEESDPSFGELSNGDELKSPHKSDVPDIEMPTLVCNGTSAGTMGSPESKAKTEPEKKFICNICGQAFRTKSYLNKHQHRVHKQKAQAGSGLSDLAPTLSSPFSPQQNMSLLESFGFQIVQSAFASSLVDADAGQSGLDFGGK